MAKTGHSTGVALFWSDAEVKFLEYLEGNPQPLASSSSSEVGSDEKRIQAIA
jgi:hypothetical protein